MTDKSIFPLSFSPLYRIFGQLPPSSLLKQWHPLLIMLLKAPFLSFCQSCQHTLHSEPEVQLSPLFILGYWRSGTTFLHEMLSLDPQFASPNTYQCFNPQTFLLNTANNQQKKCPNSVKRPMDDMLITPDSPQEDEFALLGLGAPSPYELWITPKRMKTDPYYGLDLEQLSDAERQRWENLFAWFIKAYTLSASEQRRPLLKSPSHSFRIAQILKQFPDARFIYLVRDPVEVKQSASRMFHAMLNRYALDKFDKEWIESYIIKTRLFLEVGLQQIAPSLGEGKRFCTVHYADLADNPSKIVKRIYEFHNFHYTSDFHAKLHSHISEISNYCPSSYKNVHSNLPEQWLCLKKPVSPCPISL